MRENKLNRWVNAKGNRSYVFDNVHNKKTVYLFQQCRCDFNEKTKQVTFNYIMDGWVNERAADTQIKQWMRTNVTKGKLICTVENMKFGHTSGETSRIQVLWLNKTEKDPDEKIMLGLEERINQLPSTSPMKDENMTKYHRKTYGEADDDTIPNDRKTYVTNTKEIMDAIERGEELEYM